MKTAKIDLKWPEMMSRLPLLNFIIKFNLKMDERTMAEMHIYKSSSLQSLQILMILVEVIYSISSINFHNNFHPFTFQMDILSVNENESLFKLWLYIYILV